MRTTLNIDEDVLELIKREARRSRTSLAATANRILRLGLERTLPSQKSSMKPPRVHSMGVPAVSSMDKALQLAALLEDDESLHKLSLGK